MGLEIVFGEVIIKAVYLRLTLQNRFYGGCSTHFMNLSANIQMN